MSKTNINEIEINGTKYVRKDSVQSQQFAGNRCVVILDRGWIFAGNVERKDGRLFIHDAVQVQNWSGGFDHMIQNPDSDKVNLKHTMRTVDCPADAELFCVPVEEDWGNA